MGQSRDSKHLRHARKLLRTRCRDPWGDGALTDDSFNYLFVASVPVSPYRQRKPHVAFTALMTRRSSARSTPRTSVGRRDSIRFHCSSLSQNRFPRTVRIPFQKRIRIVFSEQKTY